MDGSTVNDPRLKPSGLDAEKIHKILKATLDRLRELDPKGGHSDYTIFHAGLGGEEKDKEMAYAAAGRHLIPSEGGVASTPQVVIDWCLEYLRLNKPKEPGEPEAQAA